MKLARKLREEPGVRYRDCAILQSAVRAADTRLPLYTITGRFPKGAGTHPLLASAQAAMEWIDAQHAPETGGSSSSGPLSVQHSADWRHGF